MRDRAVKKIMGMLAILWCFAAVACAAPVLPSADGEIREIGLNRPRAVSQPLILNALGNKALPKQGRGMVHVKSFVFDGRDLPEKQLEEALANFVGRDLTMADLYGASAKAAAVCRAEGYPAVTVYLPMQDMQSGVVKIKIMAAKTEAVESVDRSALVRGRIADFAAMKKGESLTNEQLEKTAAALGVLHGVDASVLMLPGQTEETVRVQIRAQDARPVNLALFFDNSGRKSTGRYRYGVIADANNADRMGGKFQLAGIRSNGDVENYSLRYETPFGNHGGKIGFLYAKTDYSLGDRPTFLGAFGIADTASVYGSVPLRRSYRSAVQLHYGYDHKKLTDRWGASLGEAKKSADVWHVGLTSRTATEHFAFNAALMYDNGRLALKDDRAKAADLAANTAGHFHKGTLDVNYRTDVAAQLDLLLALHGQIASRNLDASEQFSLGGMYGVRAYGQNEATGDSGYQVTAEFRRTLSIPHVSLLAFVDTGRVRLSKSGEAHRRLSGWGIGAEYALPDNFYVRAEYAWKIGAQDDLSEGRSSNGRAWLQVCKLF